MSLLVLKIEGATWNMGGLELLGVAAGSQPRNCRSQSYNLKELNSSNFSMTLNADYSPKPPDKSLAQPTPVSTLMRTQVSLPRLLICWV